MSSSSNGAQMEMKDYLYSFVDYVIDAKYTGRRKERGSKLMKRKQKR